MKKIVIICVIVLIIIALCIVLISKLNKENTKNNADLYLDINITSNIVNAGDEIEYIVKTNKTVVACNYNIIFDKNVLEFVESETSGLYAAVNGENVACIYADIGNTGLNEFKIKFKAVKSKAETQLKITNVKFREINKENSYTDKQIGGIDKQIKLEIK